MSATVDAPLAAPMVGGVPYETVIGIECHVELKTETKMFCGCRNVFGAEPNTNVCPVCLGMPGALPVPNRRAIELLVKAGLAFDSQIPAFSKFDRKNYFYPDMPKDYQISQFDTPLTQGGSVSFILPDGTLGECRLTRIHLEEDTGKSTHAGSRDGRIAGSTHSLVDFNRAGVPLMECVSEPDIRSAAQAVAYLETLKRTFVALGISDVKMEEGSLRCDVNLSLRPIGASEYGTKTEIKNMNSFRSVGRAIESEVARQVAVLESGGRIVQETRGWDEAAGTTHSMRNKEQAHDYRYFPDPDLSPIEFASSDVERLRGELGELPQARLERLINHDKLSTVQAHQLIDKPGLAEFYEATVLLGVKPQAVVNYVLGDLSRLANETGTPVDESRVTPQAVAQLISMTDAGTISSRTAKELVARVWAEGSSPATIVDAERLGQNNDADFISEVIENVLAEESKAVQDFQGGKASVLKHLVGKVIKSSKGKIKPEIAERTLRRRLAVDVDSLLSLLPETDFRLRPNAKLRLSSLPRPFVSPTFAPLPPSASPFDAEIILVRASAAVGKSTLSRFISAKRKLPRIDLSEVSVGLNSFAGTLTEIISEHDVVEEFHNGRLPIVIDSVDEGRIRVKDAPFDEFLTTLAQFIGNDRRVKHRPKVIMFGRPDSIDDTKLILEMADPSVTIKTVDVRLFDRIDATEAITEYANLKAKPHSVWHANPIPARHAIEAFFEAIGGALNLGEADLWEDDEARSFAGYAPVLVAIGETLADVLDFASFTSALQVANVADAWSVIEGVLTYVLKREQTTVQKLLHNFDEVNVTGLYDPYEQMQLVARRHAGLNLDLSKWIGRLAPDLLAEYQAVVEMRLEEHPFLRNGQNGQKIFAGSIIAAKFCAGAFLGTLSHDYISDHDFRVNARQPFLWRSLQPNLAGQLVDGERVGYALASFWSEPILDLTKVRPAKISIRGNLDGSAAIDVPTLDDVIKFEATQPVLFYSLLRDIEIHGLEDVTIEADRSAQSSRTFFIENTSIRSSMLNINADELHFDGDVWLDPTAYVAPAQLQLAPRRARIGFGSGLISSFPFNRVETALSAPDQKETAATELARIVATKSRRMPIFLSSSFEPLEFSIGKPDAWLRRDWQKLGPFLESLVKHGFATRKNKAASGVSKIELSFKFSWPDLIAALRGEGDDLPLRTKVEVLNLEFP